jgi:hypothetical protein
MAKAQLGNNRSLSRENRLQHLHHLTALGATIWLRTC